jgi:prepilin-type N-terminal cleavage/methylation domain-containing protein
MIKFKNQNKKGFALVELMVASAIITVMMFAITQAAQKGILLSERALHETQAGYLMEEGAEAVKTIRDTDVGASTGWDTLSALTDNTTYYLSYISGWSLSTTPNTIDSFTRTVVFSPVYRDINDDITSSGGTLDTHIKNVTVTVSWPYAGSTLSKTLSFYVVDIFN